MGGGKLFGIDRHRAFHILETLHAVAALLDGMAVEMQLGWHDLGHIATWGWL